MAILRRLQAQTLKCGGPFIGMQGSADGRWPKIVKTAGGTHVPCHDLRRSFVTRLIRAGVALPTVKRLAGHSDIQTTLSYYNQVDDADLRSGVEKQAKAFA